MSLGKENISVLFHWTWNVFISVSRFRKRLCYGGISFYWDCFGILSFGFGFIKNDTQISSLFGKLGNIERPVGFYFCLIMTAALPSAISTYQFLHRLVGLQEGYRLGLFFALPYEPKCVWPMQRLKCCNFEDHVDSLMVMLHKQWTGCVLKWRIGAG